MTGPDTTVFREKLLRGIKELRTPLWLSSRVTDVFVATPDAPYWTGTGGDHIYTDCNGDTFATMAVESIIPKENTKSGYNFNRGIEKYDREGKRKWYLPGYNGYSMCYSPIKDTILTYETGPAFIAELDAKTGKPLRRIDKTESGPVGGIRKVDYGGSRLSYDARDHEKFWYADPVHHIVAQTDFSGKVYQQLGEYDVPGNDDNHFNTPKTVSNTYSWGHILVGDTGNHRVIEFMPNMCDRKMLPFPEPYASYTVAHQEAVYTGGCPASYYGIFIFSDNLTFRPINYLPFSTDSFVVHPKDPTRALIRWDDGLSREVDISGMNCSAPPTTARLFSAVKANRNTVVTSPPIIDFYRPNKGIILKSTKAGTVLYEAAEFTAPHAKWNGCWCVIDKFKIEAGTPLRIKDNTPAGSVRISVILEGDGMLDGWASLS